MKKAIAIVLVWIVIALINVAVFDQYEPVQQQQILSFAFSGKTAPFFILFLITMPLAIYLTAVLVVFKPQQVETDMETESVDIPLSQLRELVAVTFNGQKYQQTIDSFDQISKSLESDPEKLAEFHMVRALKVIALGQLDGDDLEEVEALEKQWGDNADVMYFNCHLFMSMQFYQYILVMQTQTREVLTAKLKSMLATGALDAWEAVQVQYDSLPPTDAEQRISITINGEREHYMLDDIKAFNLNNDLPNNNVYINFTVEKNGRSISASIPGRDNDGICAEGSLKVTGSEEHSYDVDRNHLSDNHRFSLAGIITESDGFRISIANVKLLNSLVAEREGEQAPV